jgi:hypothetical protein
LLAAPVAGDREADEVGHRPPGHEDAAELRRQLEQIAQPLDAQGLEAAAERRGRPGARVLIEGAGQPVRRQRRRRRAADHEMEEARSGRTGGGLLAELGELGNRGQRAVPLLGELAADPRDARLAPGRLDVVVLHR